MTEPNLERCYSCIHYEPTALFDLCKHHSSRYSIAGKVDYHTISHMRSAGSCRDGAVLFEPIAAPKRKRAS